MLANESNVWRDRLEISITTNQSDRLPATIGQTGESDITWCRLANRRGIPPILCPRAAGGGFVRSRDYSDTVGAIFERFLPSCRAKTGLSPHMRHVGIPIVFGPRSMSENHKISDYSRLIWQKQRLSNDRHHTKGMFYDKNLFISTVQPTWKASWIIFLYENVNNWKLILLKKIRKITFWFEYTLALRKCTN